jgi:DNA-binding NtrC family response regulator
MTFSRFRRMHKDADRVEKSLRDMEKPLIQVIDDDLRIRQGLQLYLQKAYQVRLCSTGEEGINAVDEHVAIVVLDIKMPGKNGLQVYEALKAGFPDLPIIFYSAYQSDLEGAELSRKYKPFSYIDKSADVQELIAAIARAVKYSQDLRDLPGSTQRL